MSLRNPLKKQGMTPAEQRFVEGSALKDEAPAKTKAAGKTRVPIMVDDHMLPEIDRAARKRGLSRSAFIRQAVYDAVAKA